MKVSRTLLLVVIAVFLAAFFMFDLQHYLTLETLKPKQAVIESYRITHPRLAIIIYSLIYITVTGLSLPGATVLTLAGEIGRAHV